LIAEPKVLPANYEARFRPRLKHGHRERELDVAGEGGSQFRVILRESNFNVLDFSVILAVRHASTLFRLRRYNGRSHEHTNTLEHQTFYAFHIHTATARYQDSGLREDTYAEPSDRFASFQEAVECMIADCGFVLPEPEPAPQLRLL